MQNCIIMGACIINYNDFLKCESWELITAVMVIILICTPDQLIVRCYLCNQ